MSKDQFVRGSNRYQLKIHGDTNNPYMDLPMPETLRSGRGWCGESASLIAPPRIVAFCNQGLDVYGG